MPRGSIFQTSDSSSSRDTGSPAPKKFGGHKRPRIEGENLELLLAIVEECPDYSLIQYAAELEAAVNIRVCHTTIHRTLTRAGYTLKKSRGWHLSETEKTS